MNRPFVEALHLGESHRTMLGIDTAAAADAHETLVALGTPGNDDHRRV